MLASTPRPPHLLSTPSMPILSDVAGPSRSMATPPKSQGLRGFFSRARSPEPAESGRGRWRSGGSRPMTSGTNGDVWATPTTQRMPVDQRTQRTSDGKRHRPPSPGQTKRNIRFAPSILPAMQKGEDGKWQPPSLSRGSMSTSALALYARDLEDEGDDPMDGGMEVKEKKKGNGLTLLFQSGRFGSKTAIQPAVTVTKTVAVSSSETTIKGHDRDRTARPPQSQVRRDIAVTPRSRSPVKDAFSHTPKQDDYRSDRPERPGASPVTGGTHRRARSNPPMLQALPLNPVIPPHARAETELPPLSKEHYLIRLSTSYMVKCLVPIIRGSGFVNNDKNMEVRRIADERLTLLERMERNWGGDWMKAATAALSGEADDVAMEQSARVVGVGSRQKERERRTWGDALRDGVLLCFMFNHLMPSQPPHIARVNISEDGILRATNVARVIAACQAIGMPSIDVFDPADLHNNTEQGFARVARTILALARRSNRGLRARSPVGTRTPSRAASPTPGISPSGSPRRSATALPSSRRASREVPLKASDEANDLHAKLQAAVSQVTPPSSTFAKHPVTPIRPAASRVITQPASPVRSPPMTPRSGTPTRSSMSGRPSLRPRYTTGSKVAFLAGPPSPRSIDRGGLHARERTPSLISSSSRITSGYTRTSTAMSIGTVVGENENDAVDLAEEEEDDERLRARSWERRESEQTLHNARQKILGTLLSSEDLPSDLREALQRDVMVLDEARGHAISQSLAALEGRPSPTSSAPSTPSRRPNLAMRRVQTEGHGQVDRLSEAEEPQSSAFGPGSGFSQSNGRPSAIRRISASGKMLVPKQRSSSPTGKSPTSTQFPSILPSRDTMVDLQRRGSRVRRRQSEAQPSASQSSVYLSANASRPGSAIHLPSSGAPSLHREGSSQSMIRAGPGETLVFEEPGVEAVRYQLGNCVGRGQFGSVYRSLNLSTGQMVAIKRIRLHGMKEAEVRDVMKEVELLKSLDHPSIVKYQGMSRDQEYLNIVLEFVENGSLGQTIKSFGTLNERLVSTYVAKILEGLDYLHSQGVVHCDLKAANILSTKTGNVKLSDFGVSLNMKAVENIQHDAATKGKKAPNIGDVAGTPNWMAPEVISLNGASPASDIWSLGCTIIELLTGKPPYAEITNSMSVLFRIVEDEMPPFPEVSPELQDFLKLCFIKDPRFRPSAATLFEHVWVRCGNPELRMLRPQDSVPFLRRVSMNSSRANSTRLFANDGLPDRSSRAMSSDDLTDGMRSKRTSYASFHDVGHPREGSDDDVKAHTFIKTSFGQAIICRICHLNVRKVGVLCQSCGLIAHAPCASKSPARCDAHEQAAIFARQQEYLQTASSSRAVSPQASNEHLDGFKDFQARILNGLKRSKTALRQSASPTPDSEGERRRRLSGRGTSLPPGAVAAPSAVPARPPLGNDGARNSRMSRSSIVSDISMTDSIDDARRRSAIRFDLGALSAEMEGKGEGRVTTAEASPSSPMSPMSPMSSISPVSPTSPVTVAQLAMAGQKHVHGKRESKSDCSIQ